MKKTTFTLLSGMLLSTLTFGAQAITLNDLQGSYQSMVYMSLTVEISGSNAISKGFTGPKEHPGFAKGRMLITDISNTSVPPKNKGGAHQFSARCSTIEGNSPFRKANCQVLATRDPRGNIGFSVNLHESEKKGSPWPKILSGRFNRIQ